jgi:hypothetical protein
MRRPATLRPCLTPCSKRRCVWCEAAFGQVFAFDGEKFEVVAVSGLPEFAKEVKEWAPFRPPPRTALDRFVNGADVVHIADVTTEPGFSSGGDHPARRLVEVGKCRTLLSAALHKDEVLLGALLGAIPVYRQEVRPFSDKQIALLRNFAAQAVIAMENARLITETREALEQQTATAEVLGVINSSPGDLKPVFDAILEKAHTLLGASYGLLGTYDGEQFRAVATHGLAVLPLDGARSVYAYARFRAGTPLETGADIQARMFTPRMTEDPATGSATAAAAAMLAETSDPSEGELTFRFVQGVDMGRPSLLVARVLKRSGAASAVHVGGRCVSVMQGSFYLPGAI